MSFSALVRNRNTERLIALVSAVAVLLAMVAIYAPPAQAHNGTVTWDCDGWSIGLSAYGAGADITVTVDGVVVDSETNWTSYTNTGSWDETQSHTLQVIVDAYDDGDQPVYNRGSNGSFSPDWPSGEWSFTLNVTQDACNPPPQTVTTAIVAGSCEVGQGSQASGSIDVTITPASGATVTVYSDAALTNPVGTLTETGSISGLAPGTYYWTAEANDNFQLTGSSSGQVTIADCEVTVSVGAGVCTVDDAGAAVGSVEIVIDPVSGATVTVYSDAGMTQEVFNTDATGTFDLAPGTYYWSADAAGGFDIGGASSGQFTIDPCDVTVDVTGVCVLEGNVGSGEISVTISVDGGATVVVTDSDGVTVGTLTETGTVTVPEGASYSWTASPNAGLTISGDDSGSVDIEECTPPDEVGAAILVTVEGTCEVTNGVGRGEIDVTISVADGATVTITDESGDVVGTFTSDGTLSVPEGAIYSWVATPSDGFEFPVGFESSGTIDIDGCTPDEVLASIQVTVSGSCELDGDEGEGFVDVSISVPNGATVVVRDSDGDVVGTLTDDATLSVPEGATYTWEATASEGFEFPPGFDSSGTITIERCSDPETLPFTGFDPYQMGVFALLLMGAGVAAMYLGPREEGA